MRKLFVVLAVCCFSILAVFATPASAGDPSLTGTLTVTDLTGTSITVAYQQTGGAPTKVQVVQQCSGHASNGVDYALGQVSGWYVGSGTQSISITPIWIGKAHEYVAPDYCQAFAQVPSPGRTVQILAFIQTY